MFYGKSGTIFGLQQGARSLIEHLIFMATFIDRDSSMAIRRNEFLEDLMEVARKHLQEHVSAPAADLVAGSLTDHLADYWGGQLINIPKDYHWKLGRRELEIYDAYNGTNLADLARRYDISERGLRKLLARVRKRIAKASSAGNHDLFNG